jgi:hypothetical protein
MPEPRLPVDLPPALTTLHLSGQGLIAADLEVDQEIVLLVKATVRKAGMAHDADGPPHPFATAQAETVRLLADGEGANLLVGLTATLETAGASAVADDRRRRARSSR